MMIHAMDGLGMELAVYETLGYFLDGASFPSLLIAPLPEVVLVSRRLMFCDEC